MELVKVARCAWRESKGGRRRRKTGRGRGRDVADVAAADQTTHTT